MQVTVRAQFCKIDRVLLGMQFAGAVLGVQVTVRAHFYEIDGRVQGGAVWGCCLVQLGVLVQLLLRSVAFFARLMAGCLGACSFGCCWSASRGAVRAAAVQSSAFFLLLFFLFVVYAGVFFWPGWFSGNVDPIFINPSLLIRRCSPPI